MRLAELLGDLDAGNDPAEKDMIWDPGFGIAFVQGVEFGEGHHVVPDDPVSKPNVHLKSSTSDGAWSLSRKVWCGGCHGEAKVQRHAVRIVLADGIVPPAT